MSSTEPTAPPRSPEFWIKRVRLLPATEQTKLRRLTRARLSRYIPHNPAAIPQQAAFLLLHHQEALYGGAAGGGKSDALLMAALQYADVPGYSALLLRRSFPQLAQADGLLPRAQQWLEGTGAVGSHTIDGMPTRWSFPGGGDLRFGHMQHEADRFNYQGGAYQLIGFDELTQFTRTQYTYLLSRLRRLETAKAVPLRVRSASNPGGIGHEWVRQRFLIEGRAKGRVFIPAKLRDNVFLDAESYERALAELDEITRRQLLEGDWSARETGGLFRREWFEVIDPDEVPAEAKRVRYWDLAASKVKAGRDPDWTAGAGAAWHEGIFYLTDMRRKRDTPHKVEKLVAQTAREDGRVVAVWMEQEPGASGVSTISHYARNVLAGYEFRGHKVTGEQTSRVRPLSAAAQNGHVKLVRGAWMSEFLNEAEAYPNGSHDDQVVAAAGAHEKLAGKRGLSPADLYGERGLALQTGA